MAELHYLQITRECNQRCLFCSNPPTGFNPDPEELEERILKLQERGASGIILTGGEPTLSPLICRLIRFASRAELPVRVITNGQKTSDAGFMKSLRESGLGHIHVSVYSMRPEVQARITGNPFSLANILTTLENALSLSMRVDLNVTISSFNQDHLHHIADFLCKRFPEIRHFVFNNLDPETDRCMENRHSIPDLTSFDLSLNSALNILCREGKTFRVERVPLCYMPEFPHTSTETRKIVKGEVRVVNFLDIRGETLQDSFMHEKGEICRGCPAAPVCAGLYRGDRFYSMASLFPLFIPPERIEAAVVEGWAGKILDFRGPSKSPGRGA